MMIIDKIRSAGLAAYLQRSDIAGDVNLGGSTPISGRTPRPGRRVQHDISAIHLEIIAADLRALLDPQPQFTAGMPLFELTVMKEMFPGLFADPFRHRVHTVAGFDDFRRGTAENCRVMEIDGIPTLVSLGVGSCQWTSPIYELPSPTSFDALSWELATSRLTPPNSITYNLKLHTWNPGQPTTSPHTEIPIAPSAGVAGSVNASAPRLVTGLSVGPVGAFRIVFTADVTIDSDIYERHGTGISESIGRPFLRAINLLEPVESPYCFYSLSELLAMSSDVQRWEDGNGALLGITAALDISARLVFSENQDPDPGPRFEYVEAQVRYPNFKRFSARLEMEEFRRTPVD